MGSARMTGKQAAEILGEARSPIIIAGDGVGDGDGNAWPELREFAELLGAPVLSGRYLAQPALDLFHHRGGAGRATAAAEDPSPDPASRLPLIF
jgi:thiamine pyrophosphate-dependent acetolactate synthase large subunit-like protein